MSAAAHGAEAVGPVETAVHRLAPQCKVAALLAFVVAVALVPYRHAWPYAIDAALLGAVVVASRTPPSLLARRLVVEIPFVAFVLVLPFVARGPQVDVLGVGVAAAVADDEQGGRLVHATVLVRLDRAQVGHASPRTASVAAAAIAGSASAAAHASGRAGASRPVAGMRPS